MKCYELCQKTSEGCRKESCRHWIGIEEHLNCTLLASREGPMTLQRIGDIFGITRMRICQIEKKVLDKIRPGLENII
jgi:hypothetical protein